MREKLDEAIELIEKHSDEHSCDGEYLDKAIELIFIYLRNAGD